MTEIKVRGNLNTGKSIVIQEKIVGEDLHGTDVFCEHIIELLEENNLFPAPGNEFCQRSFIIN